MGKRMNSSTITRLVKYCLFSIMAMCVVDAISNQMQIILLNEYFVKNIHSDASFEVLFKRNNFRVWIVRTIFLIIIFSSYFIIGRWFYVSAKINHLSSKKDLQFTPGWSVGWYFIPGANFIMPYRSLKETFQASFDREDWQNQKVPYDLPLWWGAFLISYSFRDIASTLFIGVDEIDKYTGIYRMSYIHMIIDILFFINAFFLLRIINVISSNHNKARDRYLRHVE